MKSSLARHWARDWRALALTQVHHEKTISFTTKLQVAPKLPLTNNTTTKLCVSPTLGCGLGTGLARTGTNSATNTGAPKRIEPVAIDASHSINKSKTQIANIETQTQAATWHTST